MSTTPAVCVLFKNRNQVGRVFQVVINKRPLAILEDSLDGRNIEPCPHPCAGEPCMNNGQCQADGEVYSCSCPLGYTNTNCEDSQFSSLLVCLSVCVRACVCVCVYLYVSVSLCVLS